jgi:hypothetical protein
MPSRLKTSVQMLNSPTHCMGYREHGTSAVTNHASMEGVAEMVKNMVWLQ